MHRGQLAVDRQRLAETVQVARHHLACGALRELAKKRGDLRQICHPTFSELVVLAKHDAAAVQRRLVSGEDVFREIDLLRGLRDAAAREEVKLVEQVWVAVVEAHIEWGREHALEEGAKIPLLHRHEDRRDKSRGLGEAAPRQLHALRRGLAGRRLVAGLWQGLHVLGEAHDCDWPGVALRRPVRRPAAAPLLRRLELLEQVANFQGLLEVLSRAVGMHSDAASQSGGWRAVARLTPS